MKRVAFICVHNSCRSQMAEAFGKVLGLEVFECFSAGTEKRDQINQDAVRIMKEIGIDMELHQKTKLLQDIPNVDIVVTMGCHVNCPVISCNHREDWGLDDPSGKSDDEFRIVRNLIKAKMEDLIFRIKSDLIQ
ncbi:Arsenate reductase [Sporomusa silvacetica DSM 10669]|uniref:Arsenate reductase n=1 Tax=Sporomusa silvacetica DSM 10669 TaxID=1123289 RepID=A0ABZ3IR54_9FIRM|nr:arsenate reductase ArsC [Sporomusa silvacetica]OZC22876.1 glutaredoxin arsenate reductase [Sporomusa silvacetica DSM 10669]